MACFVTGDATMKYMSAYMPTGQTMFIRGIIAVEGVDIPTISSTHTISQKPIAKIAYWDKSLVRLSRQRSAKAKRSALM